LGGEGSSLSWRQASIDWKVRYGDFRMTNQPSKIIMGAIVRNGEWSRKGCNAYPFRKALRRNPINEKTKLWKAVDDPRCLSSERSVAERRDLAQQKKRVQGPS